MATSKKSLKTKAYSIIKKKIIDCEYAPGESINEQMLMEEIGVSRTPIREALNAIEQEGYIKIIPKIGVAIKEISYTEVEEIFQVRDLLEPYAIEHYGNKLNKETLLKFKEALLQGKGTDCIDDYNLDTDMHRFFFQSTNNKYLISLLNRVLDQNNRVIIISRGNGARMHDSKCEHIAIIDALLEDNIEEAARLMREHIQNCKESTLNYYTKYYLK